MKQYEIALVGLDPTVGAEMQKTRPCLIISPDEMNDLLRTVQVALLTTNIRAFPWRVAIKFQRKRGMIALDQIRTVDRRRILRRLGKAQPSVIQQVKAVIEEMLVK